MKIDIKDGQWLFTCSLQPKRFKCFEENKNRDDYNMSDEEWEKFKFDDFITMEGSSHSVKNCGLQPISEKYALWFIQNECWKLLRKSDDGCEWDEYEEKIKELCVRDNIEYEGY